MFLKRSLIPAALVLGAMHSTIAAAAQSPGDPLPPSALEAVTSYLKGNKGTEVAPIADSPVDLAKIDSVRTALFAAYAAAHKTDSETFKTPIRLQKGEKNTLSAALFPIGKGLAMPYLAFSKGEKPEGGWPLIIAMHGGGGTSDKLPHPHAWPVNTSEWKAQTTLAVNLYPDNAIYFVPRMVDDNQGRWWKDFNITAFDALIRHATLFWDINPDRVYLLGISEGGYGTETLATRIPDRLAAVSAMACGYGTSIHIENVRNLAYRTDVGSNDTMFGRVSNVRKNFARLEDLHKQDPSGYVFSLNIQEGKGHGVDYRPGPKWMIDHVRKAVPERVVLTTYRADQQRNNSAYWLQITKDLGQRDVYLDARIDKSANTIRIKAEATASDAVYQSPDGAADLADPGTLVSAEGLKLRLWLHESLLDLSKPVAVSINEKEMWKGKIVPGLKAMAESLQQFGDPRRIHPAYVDVEVGVKPQ